MGDDGENQTAIIEYKPSCKSLVAEIHKHFLVQYVNGRRTEIRKCLSCSSLIKSVKSGTSALQKHRKSCISSTLQKRPSDQPYLSFTKVARTDQKGFVDVARLVYEDNVPVNKVVTSSVLQSRYKRMNFAKVTHHSVNVTLEAEYQYVFEKIKVLIAERDKKQVLGLSFDKWTSADGKKFIGVYLYAERKNICLGLVHCVGRCGAEEI